MNNYEGLFELWEKNYSEESEATFKEAEDEEMCSLEENSDGKEA